MDPPIASFSLHRSEAEVERERIEKERFELEKDAPLYGMKGCHALVY